MLHHRPIAHLSAILSCASVFACGETIDPVEGGFGDVASHSAGGSETGIHLRDVGPGELDPGECIADPKMGVYGYRHQCGGYFIAHIGFTYEDEPQMLFIPAAEQVHFGDGYEPYDQTKVMACCGPMDPAIPLQDQPPTYAENCLLDFRQQACISLAVGLAALIDDGTIPLVYAPKATDIQNYLAAHTQDCIEALLPDESDTPTLLLGPTWNLPDDGPWSSHLDDVHVKIDFALLNNIHLPEQATTCESLQDNNANLFLPPPTPLGDELDVTLDDGEGGLSGPGSITGNASFASWATGCTGSSCSHATFSTFADEFSIDQLQLDVNGDLRVSNGVDVELIQDARIELYGSARGLITGGGRSPILHTIAAGDAQFLVVGEAAGERVTIPVLTVTPIVAHEQGGAWTLEAFSLEYVDDGGATWTLTVGATQWL